MLIEVDGTYWHGKNLKDYELNEQQKQTRKNDMIKNELASNRNYKLIRIWSDELSEFDMGELVLEQHNVKVVKNFKDEEPGLK